MCRGDKELSQQNADAVLPLQESLNPRKEWYNPGESDKASLPDRRHKYIIRLNFVTKTKALYKCTGSLWTLILAHLSIPWLRKRPIAAFNLLNIDFPSSGFTSLCLFTEAAPDCEIWILHPQNI